MSERGRGNSIENSSVSFPERQRAPHWRVALALVIAPVSLILIFSVLENGFAGALGGVYVVAVVGVYPTLVLLGLPLYLLLHREVRPSSSLTCSLAGAIAVLPWLLIASLNLRLLTTIFALGILAGAILWSIATSRIRPVR